MKVTKTPSADTDPQIKRDSFNLTSFLAKHFEIIAFIQVYIFCAIAYTFLGYMIGKSH